MISFKETKKLYKNIINKIKEKSIISPSFLSLTKYSKMMIIIKQIKIIIKENT